jgi:iron complex outermembrane receptor protein
MGRSPLPAGLVLASLLSPLPAYAQQGPTFALEEVVVTANRREESLQEVPMSVSAFTGEFFKSSGVTNLAGLEQYTPSLKITPGTDSNSTSIRIRGIGSVGTNVGIDPSVGVFIDGVYQGRAGMSIGDLMDIQRVEVLRGPQGTLYGKNTAAGAISVITLTPAMEYEGELELTYNSDEQAEVRGMANVPWGSSGHATRFTGYYVNGDHLYENDFNGQDLNDANKWGLKARTLFDTGASMEGDGIGDFLVTVDYTREDTDCCALAVIDYEGFSTIGAPATNTPSREFSDMLVEMGLPPMRYSAFEDTEGFAPPDPDPFGDDYWIDSPVSNKVEFGGVAVEWNHELANEHSLTFINAWRHYESDSAYDGDFTAYYAVEGSTDIDFDQYSSELRIASPGGETLDYQAGLYAFYSELDSVGTFFQAPGLTSKLLGFETLFPDGSLNIDDNNYTTTSFAAFGQLVWNITDDFSATLGLRFTTEEKDRKGSQVSEGNSTGIDTPDIPPVVGPDVFMDNTRSDSDLSPSFNLRYFFTPEWMTYASVSRGFKSGGFNQRRELEGSDGEFDEEIATNYEIGWKGATSDRRLQFNGTFYYVKYDDFQSQTFDGSTLKVTNAGEMKSYGSELELIFVPLANMVVSSAIGYNKAEYEEFDNAQCTIEQQVYQYYIDNAPGTLFPGASVCTQDLAGRAIDNAPEWTVSSFVQYDMGLSDDLLLIGRLEHSYIDEFYLDQDLDENLKNDAVDLVNLRLTLTNQSDTWEAAVWARNLLDEEYYNFGLDIPVLGGYAGVAARGTIYGATLRLRY